MRSSMLGLKASACSSDFFCSYNSIIKNPLQEPFNCLVNQFVNFFYFSVNCLLKEAFSISGSVEHIGASRCLLFSFARRVHVGVHMGHSSPDVPSARAKHPWLRWQLGKTLIVLSLILSCSSPFPRQVFFIPFLCEAERGKLVCVPNFLPTRSCILVTS